MRTSLLFFSSFALLSAVIAGCTASSGDDGEAQDSSLLGDESIKSVTFDGTTYHVKCVDGRNVDVPYADYAERLRKKNICAPQGPAPDVWSTVGPETQACAAGSQPAQVAIAPDRLAVGCVPNGNQNVQPTVPVFAWSGTKLSTTTLRTSDGYYYTPIGLSMHGGELQAFYDYNCDDNGSFQVGWGWGCIELREVSFDGTQIRSLLWGQTGENSHPSLAFTGAEYGVLWTSYSAAYFRRINDRGLVGDQDRTRNTSIGSQSVDARESARSALVWHEGLGHYGAFNVFSNKLYFTELAEDGSVVRPWAQIGDAMTQTFGGDFAAVPTPTGFAVAYFLPSTVNQQPINQLYAAIVENGSVVKTQLLGEGAKWTNLSAFATGSGMHVVANDATGRLAVTTVSFSGSVAGRGYFGTSTGAAPHAAYDVGSRTVAVTWLDDANAVHLQRFAFGR